MIHRKHGATANYTTYKRKFLCDECDALVTHEGVIDLLEIGNGPDRWIATYCCERQSCPKYPNCGHTNTRNDFKPPIMNRHEFKVKMKKLDAVEGFISDD